MQVGSQPGVLASCMQGKGTSGSLDRERHTVQPQMLDLLVGARAV